MDHPQTTQRILSLCPGIRGLERGIERAGTPLRTVAFVEIESFICANLVAEMEAGVLAPAPIWSDLKTFDGRKFRGLVDGITGGYPCQPFSIAGQRQGENDPRHLWPFISGIIDAIRPIWCFFENVDDHLTLGFDQVYRDLRDLGYHIEIGVFSAEEVGAPHERQRIFILALGNATALRWGRRSDGGSDGGWPFQTERSSALDNASINGLQSKHEISARGHCAISAGQMDDSTSLGVGGGSGNLSEPDARKRQSEEQPEDESRILDNASEGTVANDNREGEQQQKPVLKKGRKRIGNGSEPVGQADTLSAGHKGGKRGRSLRDQGKATPKSTAKLGEDDRELADSNVRGGLEQSIPWPASPGQEQYPWEEPRTLTRALESEVGLSVNGYNFREDFLRAIGNMVVPDCAEKAWITLWTKMYETATYGMDKNS